MNDCAVLLNSLQTILPAFNFPNANVDNTSENRLRYAFMYVNTARIRIIMNSAIVSVVAEYFLSPLWRFDASLLPHLLFPSPENHIAVVCHPNER